MAIINSSNFDFRDIQIYINQYDEFIDKTVENTCRDVAKEAAKKLQASSPGTGKYAKGWASKKVSGYGRGVVKHYRVYGKSGTYQLAHLLEHGHAKRGGGRVSAIVHIKPVEEWAIDKAYEDIMDAIQGGMG